MVDPMCKWGGKKAETTFNYFLGYNLYTFYGTQLLNRVYAIDLSIKSFPEELD